MSGPGGLGVATPLGPPDAGSRFAGVQREAIVPNPAAGADWVFVVPGGTWVKAQLVRALLTTSAVVANRVPVLTIANGDGLPYWQASAVAAQAAGAAVNYTAAGGMGQGVAGAGGFTVLPFPELWLPAGWSIRVVTTAIDVGDQWSAIRLLVEELDRGPYGEQVGTDATSAY